MPIVDVYGRGWRSALQELAAQATKEFVIAAPFIRTTEASWLCDQFQPSTQVKVLTNINSQSVLAGSLEIEALLRFSTRSQMTSVITLPRLHAKVFIADESAAVVTSANLTGGGLDYNYEYGIRTRDRETVRKIRRDLETYARLGSHVPGPLLESLAEVGRTLREEQDRIAQAAPEKMRRAFDARIREARIEFLSAQIGSRSANQIFGEAILLVLAHDPA